MSDLIERLSLINDPTLYDELCRAMEEDGEPTLIAARASSLRKARLCFQAVMAEMRDPSEAVVSAVTNVEFSYPVGDHNSEISLYSREQVVAILAAAADSLAREYGLEVPGHAAAPASLSA